MFRILWRREKGRDNTGLVQEASMGLDLSAFIGTANLFFTGLVILSLDSLPSIVQLPVIYLVISAVAFILAAVLYANIAGAKDVRGMRLNIMSVANWISEYPGIYLFLTAIPLLILGVTENLLVQLSTAVACYGGLILYSLSPFSFDSRRFHGRVDRTINTFILVMFLIGIYFTAQNNPDQLLPFGIAGIFLILFISFFAFSLRIKQ